MTSIFCLLLSLVNSKFFHNLYSRQLSILSLVQQRLAPGLVSEASTRT